MSQQTTRLLEGVTLLRKIHEDLIDLEVQLQMELAGHPADSGFTEAMESVMERWSKFNDMFGDDA